jgi:hypothetical protein
MQLAAIGEEDSIRLELIRAVAQATELDQWPEVA